MGANASSDKKCQPQPQAPIKLDATVKTFRGKIDDIELKIGKADQEARQWVAKQSTNPTAKARAMQALKRKKMLEKQRDEMLATQFNLETTQMQLEQAQLQASTVEATKAAVEQLNQSKQRVGVDQVHTLMDDMAELTAEMQDVQAALAQASDIGVDADAEAELEALYADQSKAEEDAVAQILAGPSAFEARVVGAPATATTHAHLGAALAA